MTIEPAYEHHEPVKFACQFHSCPTKDEHETLRAGKLRLDDQRSDVAIVETLQTITGYQKFLPGTSADAKGRLRTRLLQVLVKDGDEWKIAAYHNVDVKAGTSAPEPQ